MRRVVVAGLLIVCMVTLATVVKHVAGDEEPLGRCIELEGDAPEWRINEEIELYRTQDTQIAPFGKLGEGVLYRESEPSDGWFHVRCETGESSLVGWVRPEDEGAIAPVEESEPPEPTRDDPLEGEEDADGQHRPTEDDGFDVGISITELVLSFIVAVVFIILVIGLVKPSNNGKS